MNSKNYLKYISNVDSGVYFPSQLNIVLIEMDKTTNNFMQEVCESVFGRAYSEHVDFYDYEQYKASMDDLGYQTDYFRDKRKECMHEEYGKILAKSFQTPHITETVTLDTGNIIEFHPLNTVGLFFSETLSEKDLSTIRILVEQKIGNISSIVSIDQIKLEVRS